MPIMIDCCPADSLKTVRRLTLERKVIAQNSEFREQGEKTWSCGDRGKGQVNMILNISSMRTLTLWGAVVFILIAHAYAFTPEELQRSTEIQTASFYRTVPMIEKGRLVFKRVPDNQLPPSQQVIIGFIQPGPEGRAAKAQELLQQEAIAEKNPDLKAAHYFTLGMVLYELNRSTESAAIFRKVLESATDSDIRVAALHKIAQIGAQIFNLEMLNGALTQLHQQYPTYEKFSQQFNTYNSAFCSHADYRCEGVRDISGLQKQLTDIREMLNVKKQLANPNIQKDRSRHVEMLIKMGDLYGSNCPDPHEDMFNQLCPESVRYYEQVMAVGPHEKGADKVFLTLQNNKFAYEYEGDVQAYNQDVVNNYGPFLERYGNSPLAKDIRPQYAEAQKYLKKLGAIDKAEDPHLATIEALELSEKKGGADAGLIQQVGSFHDPRAINALLGALDTGWGAADALVQLGDPMIEPLLQLARSKDIDKAMMPLLVLQAMMDSSVLKHFSDQNELRSKAKAVFLQHKDDADMMLKKAADDGLQAIQTGKSPYAMLIHFPQESAPKPVHGEH